MTVMAQYKTEMQTTLSVPTSTVGGSTFAEIISEIKLLVMPIMAIRDAPCMSRAILKVAPRAPEAAMTEEVDMVLGSLSLKGREAGPQGKDDAAKRQLVETV